MTIRLATRSFLDAPGLRYSSFATIVPRSPAVRRSSRTIGLLPMASATDASTVALFASLMNDGSARLGVRKQKCADAEAGDRRAQHRQKAIVGTDVEDRPAEARPERDARVERRGRQRRDNRRGRSGDV